MSGLPESILNASKEAVSEILPDKSYTRYVNQYAKFIAWRETQKTESFGEDVLLAYFGEMSKRFAPTTLWSMYSMLKSTIKCNHNINIGDVMDHGLEIIVRIAETKTNVPKVFPISGVFADIVRKYMTLRPLRIMTNRFLIGLREGKYTMQVIGKNTIAQMPKKIAEFLGLPEPASYTGHSFRRTSTTILADMGAGIETIKRHGVWKSSSVAEGYIQESLGHKRKILSTISSAINLDGGSKDLNREDVTSNDGKDETSEKENLTLGKDEVGIENVRKKLAAESVDFKDTISLTQTIAKKENNESRHVFHLSNCSEIHFTFGK